MRLAVVAHRFVTQLPSLYREENVGETGGKLIISNDQIDQNSREEEKFEIRNERKQCETVSKEEECKYELREDEDGDLEAGTAASLWF